MLLSIVAEKEPHTIYIHADILGIELLEKSLKRMRENLERGECDHDHLMSASWGSCELTESMLEQEHNDNCCQVHHLKLYCWTDEWAKKHGLSKSA